MPKDPAIRSHHTFSEHIVRDCIYCVQLSKPERGVVKEMCFQQVPIALVRGQCLFAKRYLEDNGDPYHKHWLEMAAVSTFRGLVSHPNGAPTNMTLQLWWKRHSCWKGCRLIVLPSLRKHYVFLQEWWCLHAQNGPVRVSVQIRAFPVKFAHA